MENQTQEETVAGPVGPQAVSGQANAEQAPTPELTINDLMNIRAIVETATRRGAFQANELSAVGSVFDRLANFLNAVAPKPQEGTGQSEAQ